MFIIALSTTAKLIAAVILALILVINGYRWDHQQQYQLTTQQKQHITHIVNHIDKLQKCT